jgi:hypothetical protein
MARTRKGRHQKRKTKKQKGGTITIQKNMNRIANIVGEQLRILRGLRIDAPGNFDELGCFHLSTPEITAWWETLVNEVPAGKASSYKDSFLQRWRELNPGQDAGSGLTIHCLSECILPSLNTNIKKRKSDKIILDYKPGLNIIFSCKSDDIARALNREHNTKGYYFLGFEGNVHPISNILIMVDKYSSRKLNEKYIKSSNRNYIQNIKVELNKVLENLLEEEPSYYITRENLQNKFLELVENINENLKEDGLSKKMGSFQKASGAAAAAGAGYPPPTVTRFTTLEKFQNDTRAQRIDFDAEQLIKRSEELQAIKRVAEEARDAQRRADERQARENQISIMLGERNSNAVKAEKREEVKNLINSIWNENESVRNTLLTKYNSSDFRDILHEILKRTPKNIYPDEIYGQDIIEKYLLLDTGIQMPEEGQYEYEEY